MGHGEARHCGMRWMGMAGETEVAAERVKSNRSAGVEQMARDGIRRCVSERNGAEEMESGNRKEREGAEGPD
jgi:hypothetical protein